MDWYTAALHKLKADSRSCKKLEIAMDEKVKGRTIHDIKTGKADFDNLRFGTVKQIAKLYFPKQAA